MSESPLLRPLLYSGLALLLFLASGFYLLHIEREDWFAEQRQEARSLLIRYVSTLERQVSRALAVAESMESYIRHHGGEIEDFKSHSADLLRSVRAVSAIELAPDGVIRHVHPVASYQSMLGKRVVESRYGAAAAYQAMLEQRLVVSPPLILDNGEVAVIGRQPIYLADPEGDELFWGFASVLLELRWLLRESGLDRLQEGGFRYQLVIDGARPQAGDPQVFDPRQSVSVGVGVPDADWVLSIAPLQPWTVPPRFFLHLILVVVAGGLLAYLVFVLLWQPVILRRQVDRASAALQRANARYEAVFNSVREVLFQVDLRGQLTLINPAWTQISGYQPSESLGKKFEDYAHAEDQPLVRELFHAGLDGQPSEKRIELRLLGRSSEIRWVEITLQPVVDENRRVTGLSGTLHDITERKKADRVIQYQANYDTLTNLPNRKLFQDRFGRAIEVALRKRQRLALMFIDLDRFKWVNDSLGHAAGDRLLKEAAMRLTSCVRKADTVARFGGDEFIVLLSEVGTSIDAEIVARKILAELVRPFELDGRKETISGSVGITICPDDGDDIATLMNNADNVMYHVKESGRNSFKFFTDEMNQELQTRHQLSAALRSAIADDQLRLEFQPVMALDPRRPVGIEALLRWDDDEHGRVSPGEAIALAEDTQLIEELGGWILDHACAAFVRLHAIDTRLEYVCINVSPRQFRSHFTPLLEQAIKRHDLAAQMVALDITEQLIVDDRTEVWEELERFKELGVRLMLDDFGTGLTSLGNLKRLAPDAVKIQSAYLAGIVPETSAAAMIGALIAMAHSMDIRVISEGVEQDKQAEMLELLGCDFAQGYLFSPPLTLDALAAELESGSFGPTGTS